MGVMGKIKDYFFVKPEGDGLDDFDSDVQANEDVAPAPEFERPAEHVRAPRSKVVPMSSPAPSGVPMSPATNMKMVVYQPMSYEDAQNIVDNLRARKPVIVNILDMEKECAQRVVDFIAGAAYALSGTIRKVSFGIFVLTPSNVSLIGNDDDDSSDTIIP